VVFAPAKRAEATLGWQTASPPQTLLPLHAEPVWQHSSPSPPHGTQLHVMWGRGHLCGGKSSDGSQSEGSP
jgi:hypothetical protein